MGNRYAKTLLVQALGLALFGTAGGIAWAHAPAAAAGDPGSSQVPPPAQNQQGKNQATNAQATNAGKKDQSQSEKQAATLGTIQVIGGYRHSILFSTDAKRNATNFTDTVFAQGIGKLPDVNIAESLSRVPGVQLSRDNTGQGLDISIRGLGPSFTKVLLDGASVDTASIGLDQQNQNREVDLNLFPSQFFTQLTVNKSPEASQIAGGVSGTVNMRTLRPFDDPGTHLTYSLKEASNDGGASRQYSPQGTVIGSWTNSSGTFGVLGGISSVQSNRDMNGWESIGWTTPGLTYSQCGLAPPAGTAANISAPPQAACNSIGGGNWRIPDTVPATAGAGLAPGQTIDKGFLLKNNPNLDIAQISNALIPRLGRPSYFSDRQKLNSAIFSLEYRPNTNMDFYLDTLYAQSKRHTNRIDMDLVGRNGNMIPVNMQVDQNGVVTQGTFTNAQFFLEARPYQSKTQFWSVDPGADIFFGDNGNILFHVQGHVRRSWLRREVPSILVNSPFTTIQYTNNGSGNPTWTLPAGLALNDPGLGWTWNRLNIQNGHRLTRNKGVQSYVRFGDSKNNVQVGFAYNQDDRNIVGFDNSAAWQKVACDGAGDVCNGGPGAAIPTSALGSYLLPGPAGFITVNYAKLMAATNYQELSENAPISSSVQTGATSGGFNDRDWGFYVETNATTDVLNRPMRFNAGVRYVKTRQAISGPVTSGGVTEEKSFSSKFDNVLPSFNIAWSVMPNVVLRMAGSRSMTRPDPSAMLPDTNFSDPSAETATQGNPNLKPYTSTNFDLGGEWYTGGAGYVGLDVFSKHIVGFTVNGIRTIPFTQLGVAYDSLLEVQKLALQQRGGPNAATVDVQSQVNAGGTLKILGEELDWVQPLDWLVNGLGIRANYTHIKQTSSGEGAPAVAVGVSPNLWNGIVYYERGPVSVHLSYTWNSKQIASGANQNGIPFARLMNAAYKELDLSASYTLAWIPSKPQITLDALNLTGSSLRTYFQYTNATYQVYHPGRTIMLGIHGTF
ncbi:MAG: TonB-dependent receptor [Rhodanobacteraceae bacterium]